MHLPTYLLDKTIQSVALASGYEVTHFARTIDCMTLNAIKDGEKLEVLRLNSTYQLHLPDTPSTTHRHGLEVVRAIASHFITAREGL